MIHPKGRKQKEKGESKGPSELSFLATNAHKWNHINSISYK
jgi:hypothetical protein